MKACELDIVDELKVEEKNNLFTIFLIGATIQNNGKRKRSNGHHSNPNSRSQNKDMKRKRKRILNEKTSVQASYI